MNKELTPKEFIEEMTKREYFLFERRVPTIKSLWHYINKGAIKSIDRRPTGNKIPRYFIPITELNKFKHD